MKQPSKSKITFSFGENWEGYLKHALTDEGLQIARDRTSELLKLDSLSGLTFVDIGCGSGIFSYVAYQMGAGKVISIDVDPKSISCCAYMRGVAGNPEHWEIREGSILDEDLVGSIPLADVVYSRSAPHR
jgi:2-polyprenyl-6-hydroxyphenyl methylase/3-demethylubiquinone-9 3-methyltransferase